MAHRKHKMHIMSAKRRAGIKKTLTNGVTKGVSIVKNTSKKYIPKVKKYIPKVKEDIEIVGSKVTTTAKKSVHMLQQASRKLFGLFGVGKKSRKNRKH